MGSAARHIARSGASPDPPPTRSSGRCASAPDEVAADRAAHAEGVADGDVAHEVGGHLAVLDLLHGDRGCLARAGRQRVAAGGLVTVGCREPHVDVLPGDVTRPVGGVEHQAVASAVSSTTAATIRSRHARWASGAGGVSSVTPPVAGRVPRVVGGPGTESVTVVTLFEERVAVGVVAAAPRSRGGRSRAARSGAATWPSSRSRGAVPGAAPGRRAGLHRLVVIWSATIASRR